MNVRLMRLKNIALLVGGMLGSGALFAQACVPAHKFETVTAKTLTVAAYVFPPYSIPKENEQISGVDGDILALIAKKECLTVKTVVVDPGATIQYVLSGKADIAVGDWYRTADRAKVLGLSAPIYLDQMGIFSKDGTSSIPAIVGKRVGTVQGYLWVADLKKLLGNSLTLYPNPVAMAQDLAAGRIDVGTDSYAVGVTAQLKGGYPGIQIKVAEGDPRIQASMQAGQAAFPFSKTNAALGAALDANIAELHKAGAIGKILQQYGLAPSAAEVGEPRLAQ